MVKGVEWCRSNDKKCVLPYGKFVSQMIEKLHGNIPTSELREPGIGLAMIDEAALKVMHFKFNLLTSEYEKEEEEVGEKEDGPTNQMLRNFMIERFDRLDANQARIEARLKILEDACLGQRRGGEGSSGGGGFMEP